METALEVRPTVEKQPAPGRAEGGVASRQKGKGRGPELGGVTGA